MPAPRLSRLVTASLDPVLVGSPFDPGQTGEPPDAAPVPDPALPGPWPREPAGVIWCAPYLQVRRRLPGLPQAHEQDGEHEDRSCVDLMVDFDRGGLLDRVDLETLALGQTFAAIGRHAEALEAAALVGMPAEVACPALARLLGLLLAAARTPLS